MTGQENSRILLTPLFMAIVDFSVEATAPLQTEEYPVEFEPQDIVEPPRLFEPKTKAWQNPHERIGRR